MVSIRDSLSELDKIHERQSALLECYRSALRSISQYAVEIDPETTTAHRQKLAALLNQFPDDVDVSQAANSRSVLRNELRDYRDRAAATLRDLHRELRDKADALQVIVHSMAS